MRSAGTIDVSKLVEGSMAKMNAMGGLNVPAAAGEVLEKGDVTNDMAGLLQVTSSVGVEQKPLPLASYEKVPATPGMG